MTTAPYRGRASSTSKRAALRSLNRLLPPVVLVLGMLALALLSFGWRPDTEDPTTAATTENPATTTGTGSTSTSSDSSTGVHRSLAQARPPGLKLLLASHSRLFWYEPDTQTTTILHEGEGVHYGVFPGRAGPSPGTLGSVWFALRPHNWHPHTAEEFLVEVDANTGAELSRHKIASRFTHDVVRMGERVYVCSTESGEVLELEYPTMKEVRRMALFTRQQHVNSLAPLAQGSMWAMLHNLGSSVLVRVSLPAEAQPAVVGRIKQVGTKAHAIVEWRGWLLLLDSDGGALVRVRPTWEEATDPATGGVAGAGAGQGAERHAPEVVYQLPDGHGQFLKGLCVVDDVAYFGVSKASARQARDSPEANSEVAAVDLMTGKLIWQVQVPTHGLLNIIAAPHLLEGSTYRAVTSIGKAATEATATASDQAAADSSITDNQRTTDTSTTDNQHTTDTSTTSNQGSAVRTTHSSSVLSRRGGMMHGSMDRKTGGLLGWLGFGAAQRSAQEREEALLSGIADAEVLKTTKQLIEMGFPPLIGGRWPTSLPYLDLPTKRGGASWEAGIQLTLMRVDVSKLKALMQALPPEMWSDEHQHVHNAAVSGRDSNMAKFKPGVGSMFLIFSDQAINNTYIYPYYDYFKELLEPIIKQIIGESSMRKIVRLQFANMPPKSIIHVHRDMGGYAAYAHRIHVPIITSPDVEFEVCPGFEKRTKGHANQRMQITDAHMNTPGDCMAIPMGEGMVFELNNRILHRVFNESPNVSRVQLVIDVAEEEKPSYRLQPGTQCKYVKGVVECPAGTISEV